jgi:hypothetical protein
MSTEMESKYVAVIAAQAEENAKLRAALTRVEKLCDETARLEGEFGDVSIGGVRAAARVREL